MRAGKFSERKEKGNLCSFSDTSDGRKIQVKSELSTRTLKYSSETENAFQSDVTRSLIRDGSNAQLFYSIENRGGTFSPPFMLEFQNICIKYAIFELKIQGVIHSSVSKCRAHSDFVQSPFRSNHGSPTDQVSSED